MKPFMDEEFLLSTPTAQKLYHDFAETMPILDYHCHINPEEIAKDVCFENITQVWLGGDHYKWRQMRSNGVDEYYITGDAPAREKFQKMGGNAGKSCGKPVVPLESFGIKAIFWLSWRIKWRNCRRGVESLQSEITGAIHERTESDPPFWCYFNLYNRRSCRQPLLA